MLTAVLVLNQGGKAVATLSRHPSGADTAGMPDLGVDGRVYSDDVLAESVAPPRNGKVSLAIRIFDSVEIREIQYAGGIRNPHLERMPGSRDYLSEILQPPSYTAH